MFLKTILIAVIFC